MFILIMIMIMILVIAETTGSEVAVQQHDFLFPCLFMSVEVNSMIGIGTSAFRRKIWGYADIAISSAILLSLYCSLLTAHSHNLISTRLLHHFQRPKFWLPLIKDFVVL